jgi:hypothetical protein
MNSIPHRKNRLILRTKGDRIELEGDSSNWKDNIHGYVAFGAAQSSLLTRIAKVLRATLIGVGGR